MGWIRRFKEFWNKPKEKVKKPKNVIIFDDSDRVKQLQPIYKPKYLCTAKDCKCDNSCKEIIGYKEI